MQFCDCDKTLQALGVPWHVAGSVTDLPKAQSTVFSQIYQPYAAHDKTAQRNTKLEQGTRYAKLVPGAKQFSGVLLTFVCRG